MIERISGILIERYHQKIVIDVQGLGYAVLVPLTDRNPLPSIHEAISLYTHLHLRENIMELYGFPLFEERELFRYLIGLNRLGPKIGIKILEQFSVEDFLKIIQQENLSRLKTVSGLGGKLSETVLLECKRDFKQLALLKTGESPWDSPPLSPLNLQDQAVSGLMGLGFMEKEAVALVHDLLKKDPSLSLEDLIRTSLKTHHA